MPIQKGSIIETHAKYEVLEKLGEGNYGVVFLARHSEVKREVAIKVLASEKGALAELQQECFHTFRVEVRAFVGTDIFQRILV